MSNDNSPRPPEPDRCVVITISRWGGNIRVRVSQPSGESLCVVHGSSRRARYRMARDRVRTLRAQYDGDGYVVAVRDEYADWGKKPWPSERQIVEGLGLS